MNVKGFLIVSATGGLSVRKTQPNLNWDEVAISLNLTIPKQIFQKPSLTSEINIPESAASPKKVEVETIDNIQDAIMEHTGIEVKLKIEEFES